MREKVQAYDKMKYSELPEDIRDNYNTWISDSRKRREYLLEIFFQYSIKSLFFTNAVGAAALLSFMGTKLIDYKLLITPLVSYFSGVVISQIIMFIGFIGNSRGVERLDKDAPEFYEGKKPFEEIDSCEMEEKVLGIAVGLLVLVAFLCFIFGSVKGFINING